MVEVQIPRIQVTCIYGGQLHEAADWISLSPVRPDCAASRSRRLRQWECGAKSRR